MINDPNEKRVEQAQQAVQALDQMHRNLMHAIEFADAQFKAKVGKIAVRDNEISVSVLGYEVTSQHRMKSIDGYPKVVEYQFWMQGVQTSILTIVLDPDGNIYYDHQKRKQLCASNNAYLGREIVVAVGCALLDSELFQPS